MDRSGDELFARAALADDEDGGFGGGGELDLRPELTHRRSFADELVHREGFAAQLLIFGFEPFKIEAALKAEQEPFGTDRLFEEIVCAKARRLNGRLDRAMAAHHEDG